MNSKYTDLEKRLDKEINKIILSHNLSLEDIRYINDHKSIDNSESDSESDSIIKYCALDKNRKIKISSKNYYKLIMNNTGLIDKILNII